jgi:hypothetical protein
MAATPAVEQPGEGRVGVEALQAGPVDRPVAGDERAPLAVAEEGVGFDGLIGALARVGHGIS